MRSLLAVVAFALLSAGIVAWVSRAPAALRQPHEQPTAESEVDPTFPPETIARHGAYRGPLYLALALGVVIEIAVLGALARGPFGALVDRLPGPWFVQAALAGIALGLALWLVALPLAYVRGFAIQHAWGLSTQDVGGWLSDQTKGAAVSAVMSAIAVIAFIGVQRWQPRWWWLVGAVVFSVLTAFLAFIYPVVISPLFNRFTPVEESLATRVRALASEAGVEVEQVLVSDASRRTRAENAYVAGLGATKRVVLDDTLLDSGNEAETMFVVAHELGHEVEDHVAKFVGMSVVGLFLSFAVLAWLATKTSLWEWAGTDGPSQIRALPLVALIAVILGLVSAPISNGISRRFEARADEIALELTDDPQTATRAFHRLALTNLADLDPHPVAVALLFSHPPIPERIRSAVAGNP